MKLRSHDLTRATPGGIKVDYDDFVRLEKLVKIILNNRG